MTLDRKKHWENVYQTKKPHQVSWTQKIPKTSLDMIRGFELQKSAKIIDIGGGDSTLVDHLLEEGFENISVLDISESALEKAKKRLGEKAQNVTWIVSDVTEFEPSSQYDVWHDRAAFHFLNTKEDIEKYTQIVENCVKGFLNIATFSKKGPTKCSGLAIQQYDLKEMSSVFCKQFTRLSCVFEDHITPFDTVQNFLFCSFQRK